MLGDAEPETQAETESKQYSTADTNSRLQKLQEQYSQARTVSSAYVQPKSTNDSKSDHLEETSPKVKFVPRKDRYKSDTKVRKSRWSNQEESAVSTEVNPTAAEELQESVADNVSSAVECLEQTPNQSNDLTPANSDSKVPPVTEQLPPSPGTPKEDTTPPSPGTPESEGDSWMPELPPDLVTDPTSSTSKTEISDSNRHTWTKVTVRFTNLK